MITAAQTRSKYLDIQDHLQFVRIRVRDTIQAFCEPEGYAFVSRIKSLGSVSEKIESGRFKKWSELDDLIACAIVVPTLSEESKALRFLERAFRTIRIKKRGEAKKAPDVFRFDNTRFIGSLSPPANVAADDPVYKVLFEIQIRSAFEHAWSVTTHALTYKSGHVAWNRLRLSAQLKAAVEQLDILVLGFEETSTKIAQNSWPEMQAKSNITTFFKDKFRAGALPLELRPQDWSRFSDNVFDMARSSAWARGKFPVHISNKVSEIMDKAIATLGRDKIPLSISLLQFVFATLATDGLVTDPLQGYCPVITPELESLYPVVSGFQSRFDYSQ